MTGSLGAFPRSRIDRGTSHTFAYEVNGPLGRTQAVIDGRCDVVFALRYHGETLMSVPGQTAFLIADGLRGRLLLACMRVVYARTGRASWVVAR